MSKIRRWLHKRWLKRKVEHCPIRSTRKHRAPHVFVIIDEYQPIVKTAVYILTQEGVCQRLIGEKHMKLKCRCCGHVTIGSRPFVSVTVPEEGDNL